MWCFLHHIIIFNKYLKSKDFKFMYNKQQFYKHIIKNISKTVK
jgi:hypothetical protein